MAEPNQELGSARQRSMTPPGQVDWGAAAAGRSPSPGPIASTESEMPAALATGISQLANGDAQLRCQGWRETLISDIWWLVLSDEGIQAQKLKGSGLLAKRDISFSRHCSDARKASPAATDDATSATLCLSACGQHGTQSGVLLESSSQFGQGQIEDACRLIRFALSNFTYS